MECKVNNAHISMKWVYMNGKCIHTGYTFTLACFFMQNLIYLRYEEPYHKYISVQVQYMILRKNCIIYIAYYKLKSSDCKYTRD